MTVICLLFRESYDTPSGQDNSLRQTVLLAEEFLNLVVIILSMYILNHSYSKSDE
jgi:hypothetical protein